MMCIYKEDWEELMEMCNRRRIPTRTGTEKTWATEM